MITASSLAGKFGMMPGTQTVSYRVLQTAGTFATAVDVGGAEKRFLSRRDIDLSTVRLTSDHIIWHLWTANLNGISPKPGDKFTDADGVVWRIEDGGVMQELLGQRWRCLCIRNKGT